MAFSRLAAALDRLLEPFFAAVCGEECEKDLPKLAINHHPNGDLTVSPSIYTACIHSLLILPVDMIAHDVGLDDETISLFAHVQQDPESGVERLDNGFYLISAEYMRELHDLVKHLQGNQKILSRYMAQFNTFNSLFPINGTVPGMKLPEHMFG